VEIGIQESQMVIVDFGLRFSDCRLTSDIAGLQSSASGFLSSICRPTSAVCHLPIEDCLPFKILAKSVVSGV
jgi:hypothetical protein